MFGYDAIVVLPILLLLAAFSGIIAMLMTVYIEVLSKSCKICGVEFMGSSDLKEHMLVHGKVFETSKLVSKVRMKKAA
jgi:hypothetical protein